MTTIDWIATAIAIPAVGCLIAIVKRLVDAYVKQSEAHVSQLEKSDARQTQITDAFVEHVSRQTESLGTISRSLGDLVEQISNQDRAVEAFTAELTKSMQQQMEKTFEDHRKIWDTIGELCAELRKCPHRNGSPGSSLEGPEKAV